MADSTERVELNYDQSIAYLKKKELNIDTGKGWKRDTLYHGLLPNVKDVRCTLYLKGVAMQNVTLVSL